MQQSTMVSLGGGHGEPPVELLSQLEMAILSRQGKREGRETRFLCPAHDDHHPSARWNPEKKTWVCDACGAGGGWADLSKRLGLELPGSRRSVAVSYAYQDEEGRLLFEVVRYEPKDFRQRRPDGAGGWTYNLNGTRRVLYNLPRVLTAVAAGETVWLVEGEKDADNLARLGFVATTNSGGAGKWRDEYSEMLRGAKVVILPDNDGPGRQHAQTVAQRLQGVAAEVRILKLRGLPEKGDVSDWIREREGEDGKDHESTRATLEHLASTVPVFSARDSAPPIGTGGRAETEKSELFARDSAREGQPPVGGAGNGRKTTLFVTARETCSEVTEEVLWIVEPFLATGCLTDLAGPAKAAGKTTLALAMIRAVLDGGEFLGQRTTRSPVVFLTEQSRGTFRPALVRAHLTERDDLSILYAHRATTLSWPQVVAAAVEECLRIGAKLLVVDTLPALSRLRGDAENSAGEALRVLEPLQQAAGEHGIAVLYTRHERKGGGPVGEAARGSSAFAGGADVLLSLRRPEGRYGHGVRYLQSLSRFQETPPELMIELGEDGQYHVVGDQTITIEDEARADLLKALPEVEGSAVALEEILQQCPRLARTTAQRKLAELCMEGVVQHVGVGKRGDPKRYYLAVSDQTPVPY